MLILNIKSSFLKYNNTHRRTYFAVRTLVIHQCDGLEDEQMWPHANTDIDNDLLGIFCIYKFWKRYAWVILVIYVYFTIVNHHYA